MCAKGKHKTKNMVHLVDPRTSQNKAVETEYLEF